MNILFIEYNFFHDEVLIPQIDFLYKIASSDNGKINLFIIMNKDIKKKGTLDLSQYPNFIDNIEYKLVKKRYNKLTRFLNYIYILDTFFYILFHKIDIVVFNTIDVYNEDIEILLKILPSKVKKIGILHNANLIEKYKNKYDYILVLSKLIAKNINMDKVDYVYPLLYKYKNMKQTIIVDTKINKKFKICIPGNIEKDRRDYQYVIDFVINNQEFCKLHQIQFVFLGNINTPEGLRLKKQIIKQNISIFFQLFDYLIEYKQYMDVICDSDILMLLIHKTVKNFHFYKTVKVSATFNMAFSCNKPMLMDIAFKEHEEFKNFCFFYDSKNHASLKNILLMIFENKNSLQEKINYIKNEKKFLFKNQQEKYLTILKKLST